MKQTKPLPSLTSKEKCVLEFIEGSISGSGICPSFQEIKRNFNFASFNSVQNYIKQLQAKGYIKYSSNQKRAIQVLHSSNSAQNYIQKLVSTETRPFISPQLLGTKEVLSLPLLGTVAAGAPLESQTSNEFIDVSQNLVKRPDKTFVLKVSGSSMIEEGILDGDFLLVQDQSTADNGNLIIASVNNEATVKRIYKKSSQIELRPSNSNLKSMWYSADEVAIRGIVVGLIRTFL